MLLDITFEATYWVVQKTTRLLYNSVSYVATSQQNPKPAIAYSGDKKKDVIYAAGILHHENLIDNKSYETIIDSVLLLSIKDEPPKYDS